MNLHGAIEFLRDYPEMSFAPIKDSELTLKGEFKFKASFEEGPEIEDSYKLMIAIPEKFPYELPKVKELEGKIPRDYNYHINPDDTLCVGSPIRIIMKLFQSPNLNTYAEECLVPYLYAVSYKLQYGGEFIFGELEHGKKGIIKDYKGLLGLKHSQQVINSLILLSMKKRDANKQPCPCGCNKRLGACRFNNKINQLRKVAPRSFYVYHTRNLGRGI